MCLTPKIIEDIGAAEFATNQSVDRTGVLSSRYAAQVDVTTIATWFKYRLLRLRINVALTFNPIDGTDFLVADFWANSVSHIRAVGDLIGRCTGHPTTNKSNEPACHAASWIAFLIFELGITANVCINFPTRAGGI
jgi:hypothetical protein